MSNSLTDFFECTFPTALAFLAQGGPTFSTTVNEAFGGKESRVRNWSGALCKYTIDLQNKPIAYFDAVREFFYVVGGSACGFRFLDVTDHSFANEVIGTGNSSNASFQLIKTYASGNRTYVRTLTKPITSDVQTFTGSYCDDTVTVKLNNVLQTPDTDYTLDYTSGLVTFTSAPSGTITASGQFHVPCRFTNDQLVAQLEVATQTVDAIVSWPSVEIKEVRL